MKSFYAPVLIVLLTIIYALCFTTIKAGLPFLPPLLFGGMRALLGGIVLLIIVVFFRYSLMPTKYEWKWIFWIGLTTTITFFGMFLSPGATGAGIASILGNMAPLFTVLLAALVLKETLSLRTSVALLLGILGILSLSYAGLFGESAYGLSGLLLALAASGGAAASNILVKLMHAKHAIIRVSAWQLIIGSIPLLVLSFATEQGKTLIWNSTSVSILLFLSVIGTAFVTATWYLLIQHRSVGKLSLFLFLTPVFGLGISNFVYKEPLQVNELLGIGLIILATLLLIFDSMKIRNTIK